VYHGQGISKAAISAAGQQVTIRVRNTTYRAITRYIGHYMLWSGAGERPVKISRSGTYFFRICGEKKENIQL